MVGFFLILLILLALAIVRIYTYKAAAGALMFWIADNCIEPPTDEEIETYVKKYLMRAKG